MFRKLLLAFSLLFSLAAHAVDQTIYDVLGDDPRFSRFLEAVKQGGMAETLTERGPFTLFAPTNEAIEKLPGGQWIAVMESPRYTKATVENHIANGELTLSDLRKETFVETLFGSHFLLEFHEDQVTVAGALVGPAEIPAKNGLIHAVDRVLPTPYIE